MIAEFILCSIEDFSFVKASAICSDLGIHSNILISPASILSWIQLSSLRLVLEFSTQFLAYNLFLRLLQSVCIMTGRLLVNFTVSVIISLMNIASFIADTKAIISASKE